MKNKNNYNRLRKIRYQVLRDLGYSVKEAQRLRSRSLAWLDTSGIRINQKSGKVIKGKNYNKLLKSYDIDDYVDRTKTIKNDTVYSRWGMLTNDERYRDETEKYVNYVRKTFGLSNDQAHFFVYMMIKNNLTFEEAREQLLTSEAFEMYDKNKARGLKEKWNKSF